MHTECHVCGNDLNAPAYVSPSATSIDSLCNLHAGQTVVHFCDACGHLQSVELPNIVEYYANHYDILADSEDEDQLYDIVDGKQVFRAEHQAATLLGKIALPQGGHVLDFGCAKGATTRKLLAARPDLECHLFDVSDRYRPFWNAFTDPKNQATHRLSEGWKNRFDCVMSFFVLEHVVDLRSVLAAMHGLLKEGGAFYAIVPNVYANSADLVVADHTQHFSAPSWQIALSRAGFGDIHIDPQAHASAWVVSARKTVTQPIQSPSAEIATLAKQVQQMATQWQNVAANVRAFEDAHGQPAAAIYGSGFYGTYIAASLQDVSQVQVFLDRNPYRQGKSLLDKTIIAPDALPGDIRHVYVGLNPRVARQSMQEIGAWRDRSHQYCYL